MRFMNSRIKELTQKFFSSLAENGIITTARKVSLFVNNKIALYKLHKYAFDAFYQAKYIPSNTTNADILPICFYNISLINVIDLATEKPVYTNQYLPRLPLLFTENFVERINYHSRIAKEYQIYGFCYEIDNINNFTNFFSNLNLSGINMPFCISLNHKLSFENIKTIFKTINYEDYIKHDNNCIIILDCVENPKIINEFVQNVDNALANLEINYELWAKIPNNTHFNNDRIKAVINAYNIEELQPVKKKSLPFIHNASYNKLYYYNKVAESLKQHIKSNKLVYNIVYNAQDNVKNNDVSFYKYSLIHFYNWVKNECVFLRKTYEKNKRFLFIESYNNWEKLNHIVPEKRTGYAFLNTMYRAMFNKKIYGKKLSKYTEDLPASVQNAPQICVHAHIYYIDLLDEIITELKKIPYAFDVFISTDSYKKADMIMDAFQRNHKEFNVFIDVFENAGRDIAPFIEQMRYMITKYKFICHIHSKKSIIDSYGKNWRDYLFKSLFGSSENIAHIIKNLEFNKGLGIVFPKSFKILEEATHWSLNKNIAEKLLKKMNINMMLPVNNIVFPVGNMFWARVDAILPLFTYIKMSDFPRERGQIDGTVAHAIERLWVYIVEHNGYTFSYCGDDR